MNKLHEEPDMNFWIPIDFEKAKDKKTGEKIMKIKGIASTGDIDSEGEILEPVGFDLSRFLSGGFLNWNHQSKTMGAGAIIGEPTAASVNSKGELEVAGVLYNGHPLAESVWNLAETLERNKSKRKLGFSIEGRSLERDPMNPKRITKALLTGLAVTHVPVNTNTYLDLVKGQQKEDFINLEFEDELITKSEDEKYLYEFKVGENGYAINKSFELVEIEKAIIPDIEKESDEKQAKIKKVMSEFKAGTLKSSSGEVVTDKDQALAIAMSEAGIEKTMDVAATRPLIPESLDGKKRNLEPTIKKAILEGIIPIERVSEIIKGGEGSRGGKVIGHTRSGKPIYEHFNHPEHKTFSREDHSDAFETHKKIGKNLKDKQKDFHYKQMEEHSKHIIEEI